MKINLKQIKFLKNLKNAGYEQLKIEYLYHSNKLEGSTFSKENLQVALLENKIEGSHKYDDIIETMNSLDLFDFVVDTLGENLNKKLICEFQALLKKGTIDQQLGLSGQYKKYENQLLGIDLQLTSPENVENEIDKLINKFDKQLTTTDILEFHSKFENIHPFSDGNGRVGRFIILKQCIENNVDLISIDSEYEKEYKQSLYLSQKTNDFSKLIEVSEKCIKRIDEKLKFITKKTIPFINSQLDILKSKEIEDEELEI